MDEELYEQIIHDLENRKEWATKQPVWYTMRRDGIRRKHKPWPNAADMHYPLIDTIVDKLKPFYLNQLFATERMADFVSSDPADTADILGASYWFDYKLKHISNLEDEVASAIDAMLVYGRGILKVYWDVKEKKICFDAIEPLFIIVPDSCKDIRYAERLVHVKHMTPWEYKHGPMSKKYKQDESFVKQITGSQDSTADEAQYINIKRISEGITHSANNDNIVVWEVYERQADQSYKVHTISPVKPREDIRAAFKLTYKPYNGSPCIPIPFIDFTIEKTQKNWYSPRGVAEILAPYELSMCKMWNSKHDCMSVYNSPMLAAQKDIPMTQNIRAIPGQILPFPVAAIQMGTPPISFDQEMISTRSVAEQRIATPDFGIGDKNAADQKRDNKTATEVEALMSVTSAVVDMRSRIFRRSLGKCYELSWNILCQFDEDLSYLQNEEFKEMPEDVKKKVKSIKPNGSSDSWNINARWQKAARRKTLLGESKYIKQWELDKTILELDEPGLVERLYTDPQIDEKKQAELQMKEMPVLMMGFPITPNESDDDQFHIGVMYQFLISQMMQQKPPPPQQTGQAIQGHLQAHMDRLKAANPKKARELETGFQKMVKQIVKQRAEQMKLGNGQSQQQQQPMMQ